MKIDALDRRIKLEALVSEREAMLVANLMRERHGEAPEYGSESFFYNAEDIKKLLDNEAKSCTVLPKTAAQYMSEAVAEDLGA